MTQAADAEVAGLLRRLAAMVYDGLLIVAVLVAATALALLGCVLVLGAESVAAENPLRDHPLFTVYLLGVVFLFFGWFWTHGGQTLGMRAWKIRVQGVAGAPLDWPRAARRFALAIVSWLPLGLGFWWLLVDPDKLTWHDRLSNTRVVRTAARR